MVIHGILEMVDGHCQFEGLTMMRFNGWLRVINAEFSFLTRCELNLKTTSPENADDMKLEQVVEENLPFILSSSEDCETDELSELLTNKVKSKSRKRASEKSNKKSMGSINKSIKKESDSKRSEVFEDNLSELRRNKWRTVVINVGGVNYRSIRLFQINSILTMNLIQSPGPRLATSPSTPSRGFTRFSAPRPRPRSWSTATATRRAAHPSYSSTGIRASNEGSRRFHNHYWRFLI